MPLTHGSPNAVAFGVDEPPDLRQIAVPLGDVLDGGRLHQQGVVGRERSLDALLVAFHQCRGFAAHEGPHFFKRGNFGFLEKQYPPSPKYKLIAYLLQKMVFL